MEINLPFDSSEQTMDTIKLAAFYYDNVNILCPETETDYYGYNAKVPYYSRKHLKNIDMLQKNEIVSIKIIDIDQLGEEDSLSDGAYRLESAMLYDIKNIDKFNISDAQIINGYNNLTNDELENILKYEMNNEQINDEDLTKAGIISHFYYQLFLFYYSICNNQNCISSNELLSQHMGLLYKNDNKKLWKLNKIPQELIAFEAIPIFLPNFYQMSFDDIVDLRYLAKDELQEMRYYINSLSLEYSPDDKKLVNVKLLLENKIRPSIKQLESKIYELKAGTIQRALQGFKRPKNIHAVTYYIFYRYSSSYIFSCVNGIDSCRS